MRNDAIMAQILLKHAKRNSPLNITEMGAGDGCFLLQVLKRLSAAVPGGAATLVDRHDAVSAGTLAGLRDAGWQAETEVKDVFEWSPPMGEVVVANLFLHHFENDRLVELFRRISQRARLFVALEPRRARWPLFCSLLLGAIGCNAVTRHDAVISVRAGFRGSELSSLWPDKTAWHLTEQSAGLFGHQFVARKLD